MQPLLQAAAPAQDVRLWVKGLPGITNSMFVQGGINVAKLGGGATVDFDGRASKFLPHNGGIGTNRFQIIATHPAGFQHELQIILELFRQ